MPVRLEEYELLVSCVLRVAVLFGNETFDLPLIIRGHFQRTTQTLLCQAVPREDRIDSSWARFPPSTG